MSLKQIIKRSILVAIAGFVIAGSILLYLFNMPHRDVQAAEADYSLSSSQIVNEYLADKVTANKKYLASNGDSKILEVTGTVVKISEDFNGQLVVLLKEPNDKAGVNATFSDDAGPKYASFEVGKTITIKGVIRSGATYDEDLELYEHVILDKCDIVANS